MAVDCRKCKHFSITWDKARPYGCKAFGFKTKSMPSSEVHKAAGMECLRFEIKVKVEN